MTGHPLPGPLDGPATRSCELAHAQLSPTSAASLSSVNSKRARGAAKLSLSGAPEVLLPGNGIGLAQISGRLETSRAGLEGPTSIRTALGAVLSALERHPRFTSGALPGFPPSRAEAAGPRCPWPAVSGGRVSAQSGHCVKEAGPSSLRRFCQESSVFNVYLGGHGACWWLVLPRRVLWPAAGSCRRKPGFLAGSARAELFVLGLAGTGGRKRVVLRTPQTLPVLLLRLSASP